MDLSQLTESELQQLANVGNFSALGELANRRNTTTRSMKSIEEENIRNAIARNLEIDPQGDIKTFNMSQDNDLESQNDGSFIPEEEKGIFSLRDIVGDIVSKGAAGFKDIASRGVASQALGTAGGMILGPMGALVGGLAGLFKGGNLFDGGGGMAPDLQRSLYGEYGADSIGRLGSGIMAGYNPRAGNLLNRAVQRRQNVLRSMKNIPGYKGLNYDPLTDFINQQVKEQTKYYGGTGATDVTGSSDYTSTGSPTSMGSTHGGAGGRPY